MSLSFLFIQFEFTHALGPHAGRYVVETGRLLRPDEPALAATQDGTRVSRDPDLDARNQLLAGVTRGVGHSDVLVVTVVGGPASQRRLLRRARPVEPGTLPAEVPLSLLTFVKGTEPAQDAKAAAAQLDEIRFSGEKQEGWCDEGLKVINIAIRAYRSGAPDPYATDITRRDARRVRIGYGGTDEVHDGGWNEAFELPPARQARPKLIERLRPAEAVAAVLAGKTELLEAEDVLLRALIDLDHGRTRGAAYQVAAALRLLGVELGPRAETAGLNFDRLADRATRAAELADAADAGPLDADGVRELEAIIDTVVEMLADWRYHSVN